MPRETRFETAFVCIYRVGFSNRNREFLKISENKKKGSSANYNDKAIVNNFLPRNRQGKLISLKSVNVALKQLSRG